MENCIFCKIIKGEIPSTKLYEDENMIIFKDIEPKAEKHYLCVPKSHFKLLADMNEEQSAMLSACFKKIPTLAKELGLENGYRLVRTTPCIPPISGVRFRPLTCVEVVKRFLGINQPKIWTPYQLFKFLFLKKENNP